MNIFKPVSGRVRNVVSSAFLFAALISLVSPLIAMLATLFVGMEAAESIKGMLRNYAMLGPFLALVLVGCGIYLHLRRPRGGTVASDTGKITLSQKLLATILFLFVMPIIVAIMWNTWTQSGRELSLPVTLVESLFAWIGLLLVVVMVSIWRRKSEETPSK